MLEENSDSPLQMSDLTEEDISPRTYTPGEIVEGQVVRVDPDGIVVGVGLKMEGMVPLDEMRMLSLEDQMMLEPGQAIAVAIVGGRAGDMPMLSYDQAQEVRSWQALQQHLDENTVVTALVTGQNRGGLEVDCLGIRGFVPFSHLAPTPGVDRDEGLAARVKQKSEFNVLEIDRSQNRLVLTERAIWQKAQAEAQDRVLAGLEEGTILTGRISSIRDFGAFVNVGEIDGLIPISEMSWRMIKTPDEIVTLGDPVEVYVLRVDPANRRLTLSLKRTQPEPWDSVHERFTTGQVIEGTVSSLAPFGAFVNLEYGIEGLVHISELSSRVVNNPSECVYRGQKVRVMILNIDTEKRRIALSYKQAYGM